MPFEHADKIIGMQVGAFRQLVDRYVSMVVKMDILDDGLKRHGHCCGFDAGHTGRCMLNIICDQLHHGGFYQQGGG